MFRALTVDHLTIETARIVVSFLKKNPVAPSSISEIIDSVKSSLSNINNTNSPLVAKHPDPAAPIIKSVERDYIICLEDGLRFRSLRQHLWSKYRLTPEEYRRKWRLPYNYPMTAPTFRVKRAELAREHGLGRRLPPKANPNSIEAG